MTDSSSQDLVPRGQSETLEWLSKQTGTDVKQVDGQVVISFGRQIEEKLNCLAPVSQVAQVDPMFSPTPRLVNLNIASDAFEVKKGTGTYSLNKIGLSKLADAAQIEAISQRMEYMGNQGVRAIVIARMRKPDGTWRMEPKAKAVRFDVLKREVERRLKSAAKKYKKSAPTQDDIDKAFDDELVFVEEKAATKASLRCVRSLLSVKGTYTKAELAKPFLVVTWNFSPDWSNPRVAEMLALQYREGTEELYGESPTHSALARETDALPASGQHTAAALEAAEHDADALEAAEDAVAQHNSGEPDPIPAEEAAEPPQQPPAESDPEAWDITADEQLSPALQVPMPEVHFTPSAGPFKDTDVEQIVATPEGKVWLAQVVDKLKDADKRDQGLAWLEWSTNGDVTEETLEEFISSPNG